MPPVPDPKPEVQTESQGSQSGMQSLVGGLRILDLIAGARGPLRFTSLLEGSGLPKGTLHRHSADSHR